MSYPRDLEDYDDDELFAELKVRAKARLQGKCDYCKQTPEKEACRYADRHAMAGKDLDLRLDALTKEPFTLVGGW